MMTISLSTGGFEGLSRMVLVTESSEGRHWAISGARRQNAAITVQQLQAQATARTTRSCSVRAWCVRRAARRTNQARRTGPAWNETEGAPTRGIRLFARFAS